MNLHDSVLETATLTSSREFRIVLSDIPGRSEDERLALSVTNMRAVLIMGTIEPDWFLSDVILTESAGTPRPIELGTFSSIGRLIVQGTNGAFLEVVGGDLLVERTSK